MRREKTQIRKIRNEKGEIKTSPTEIQGIIRDNFENLYSNKLEKHTEMNKFLDTYDHPKLIQEDIKHVNKSITHNETEAAIESPKKTSPGSDGFPAEFYQTSKKELIPTIFSMKSKEKEYYLTHSM
jgi:hypothetical protein